jgi:pimeloyl-ACP methyl ester carboxylesterase
MIEKLNSKWINPSYEKAGPILVFLHEGLGSIRMWSSFPQNLCDSLGLCGFIFEREGYGKSMPIREKRKKDYLHIQAVEVLPKMIKHHLPNQDFILVGHSDGGSIALIFAANCASENLKGIVTVAAHSFVEDISLSGIEEAMEVYKKGRLKVSLEKHHGEKTEETFFAWADTWLNSEFKTWNILEEIKSVKCKALITQGSADEYGTPLQVSEACKAIGENAKGHLYAGLGHSPHRQDENMVLKDLVSMMEELIAE